VVCRIWVGENRVEGPKVVTLSPEEPRHDDLREIRSLLYSLDYTSVPPGICQSNDTWSFEARSTRVLSVGEESNRIGEQED
jgi:hypothetical protein